MNAQVPRNDAVGTRIRAETLVIGGEIYLYGTIDAWEVSAVAVLTSIDNLRHLEGFTVHINSPGGSISEGLAIYDLIRMCGRKVVVRIDALAGSIASIIAMAGDEVVMAEDAILMVHNPWSYAQGSAEDLRKLAETLDGMRERLIDIYLRKAGNKLTRERLIEMMDAETYLTADEAVELGLADRIDAPLKLAALAPDEIRGRAIDYYLAPPSIGKPASYSNAAEAADHEDTMSTTTQTPKPQNGPGPLSNEAIMAEARAQVTEIYNACAPLGAEAITRAADMVRRGITADAARAEVIATLADRQPGFQRQHIAASASSMPHVEQGITGALAAKMLGKRPEGPAAEYAEMSVLEMGRAFLQANGMRVPASKDRLATVLMNTAVPGLHTTSDFPTLLLDAGNRVLLERYQATQSVWKTLARRRTATDFREISSVRVSDPSPLEEVPESGEITHTTRTEAGERFVLKTYARIFALSRAAIINDQLGAFADTLSAFGRSAAETEAIVLAGLFTANGGNGAILSDGVTLYNASRGNRAATGAALSVTSLGAARAAMRTTKGIDGVTVLGLTPAYLVVGPALETEAEQILTVINAAQSSDVNVFANKLKLLVEPRISDRSWRLFADPAAAPVLAIAYLNDATGPLLDTREGWNVLGTEFRAILDFGAGITASDGAGTYLNPGQ